MSRKIVDRTRLTPQLHHKVTLRMSRPRRQRCGLTARRSMRPKENYRVSDSCVGCSARALSLMVPPSPRSVGTTHAPIGLFRVLHWGPHKAAGCGLSRDMYDTYGAPASLHVHQVAHPEAVRQDAAPHSRVPRACGDIGRTCPAPPVRGPSVGQPPTQRVCHPACHPRGLPLHALQPCPTTRTSSTPRMRPSAGGGTRSHTTSRRIQRCDTLSNQ